MGGGKSRAICEKALEYAMTCPGVQILIARQRHTSIVETTRKTMLEEVVPRELIAHSKSSMGEDFIDLYTPLAGVTSRINFVGLEDPVRWYSSQIGALIVDQVEECEEETIVKLMTRLRDPKAPVGLYSGGLGLPAGEIRGLERAGKPVSYQGELPADDTKLVRAEVVDFPLAGKVILSFNPENPGHWLMSWFFTNAERTRTGMRKSELYASGADYPFGDAEFFFAKATDNRHLAPGYVAAQLAGMPEHLRRRYLDGEWAFVQGRCYFDTEALGHYQQLAERTKPLLNGTTEGDCFEDAKAHRERRKPSKPIRFRAGHGSLTVWRRPVRESYDEEADRILPAHRYVVAVDVSSGGAADNSGIQVFDVDSFEQAAEYQGKADPDQIAQEAYRLARIYNDALIVPEVTGGCGFSVEQELKRIGYWRLYTKKVLDRISRKWTDRTGWDTTMKTRAYMLDTLERLLREKEVGLYSLRLVAELGTFVRDEKGRPAAQPGCHDDLVIAIAIAVTVATEQPRSLRRLRPRQHHPATSAVTGY